jgi:hypothetical protein
MVQWRWQHPFQRGAPLDIQVSSDFTVAMGNAHRWYGPQQ